MSSGRTCAIIFSLSPLGILFKFAVTRYVFPSLHQRAFKWMHAVFIDLCTTGPQVSCAVCCHVSEPWHTKRNKTSQTHWHHYWGRGSFFFLLFFVFLNQTFYLRAEMRLSCFRIWAHVQVLQKSDAIVFFPSSTPAVVHQINWYLWFTLQQTFMIQWVKRRFWLAAF